ncbi:hypothetical protein [Sphingomonas sp. UYP23]
MINSVAELDRVRAECRKLVSNRAMMAAGAAVVPIPGADIVADISLLATLLPDISRRFELHHEQVEKLEPHLAEKVLVLASSMGNNVIGRMVTKRLVTALLRRVGMRVATASVAKYVPFVGSGIAAAVGFGAMRLVGNSHVEDCYRTARALVQGTIGGTEGMAAQRPARVA